MNIFRTKTVLFLIGLVVIASLILFFGDKGDSNDSGQVATYTDVSAVLPVSTGRVVSTDNFLKSPTAVVDSTNPNSYFLGNSFMESYIKPGQKPNFVVSYDATQAYFNIVLLEKPYAASRNEAELYLRNLLELQTSDMCRLKYSISVPGYVDDYASGIDYRFSFCSDAVNL